MSIPFVGEEALFTRLGHLIGSDNVLQTARGTDTNTRITLINEDYIDTNQNLIDGLYSARDAFRTTGNSFSTYYQALIQATLIEMANDDNPLAPKTLSVAIDRLNADLLTAGSGIVAPTVTLTVTADADNYGDAVLVASKYDGNGYQLDYVFAEDITVSVTSDSQRGATAKREPIQYIGELSVGVREWNWPQGSGTTLTANIIDANQTTEVSNGGFETWPSETTTMATDWEINDGAINVTVLRNTTVKLGDNYSCEFASVGAELGIYQTLDLSPSTVYAFSVWISLSAVPAAGVVRVALVDQTDTVIQDAQGVDNSYSQSLLSGVPTGGDFVNVSGFFRTPKTVPDVCRLLINTSTPITSGSSLYIDRVAGVAASQLYNGGPFAAAFSGGTASQIDDNWNLGVANNKTVTSFGRSLDRDLGLRDLGKRIETGGGISDALIV